MDKLDTLIREVKTLTSKVNVALAPKSIWVVGKDLSRLAGGLTREQLRSIRKNYPEYVKGKAEDKQGHLYDWSFFQNLFPQSKAA